VPALAHTYFLTPYCDLARPSSLTTLYYMPSRCLPSLKRSLRLSLKGAEETPVCYVPQSEMVPSSPARSPSLCISWAKSRPRLQADALGTLVVTGQRRPPCTRRSVGLSEGVRRSEWVEERRAPPADFSALEQLGSRAEAPLSCAGTAARARSRVSECSDRLRPRPRRCPSIWHAARRERVLLDQVRRDSSEDCREHVGASEAPLGSGWEGLLP
jgi:hypothetical protein